MNIIEPSATLINNLNATPYSIIERAGRLCYKSEDKITDSSASQFVARLYNSGHHAMLEHGHIMLAMPFSAFSCFLFSSTMLSDYSLSRYLNVTKLESSNAPCTYYVSGSFRALIDLFSLDRNTDLFNQIRKQLSHYYPELFTLDDSTQLQEINTGCKLIDWSTFIQDVSDNTYLSDKEKDTILSKHLPHTVIFTCDRGVSHELVRHRPASFAQESTRYCNYGKDKFNHNITFIRPLFFPENSFEYEAWWSTCQASEDAYFTLLDLGRSPQEARSVLPNSVKTEIAVTATEEEWQHILNLRYHGTTGHPHPQMKQVMDLIYEPLRSATNNRLH